MQMPTQRKQEVTGGRNPPFGTSTESGQSACVVVAVFSVGACWKDAIDGMIFSVFLKVMGTVTAYHTAFILDFQKKFVDS